MLRMLNETSNYYNSTLKGNDDSPYRPYIPPIVIIHDDDRGTNDYLINIYMADMMSFTLNLYLILENTLKRQIRREAFLSNSFLDSYSLLF